MVYHWRRKIIRVRAVIHHFTSWQASTSIYEIASTAVMDNFMHCPHKSQQITLYFIQRGFDNWFVIVCHFAGYIKKKKKTLNRFSHETIGKNWSAENWWAAPTLKQTCLILVGRKAGERGWTSLASNCEINRAGETLIGREIRFDKGSGLRSDVHIFWRKNIRTWVLEF